MQRSLTEKVSSQMMRFWFGFSSITALINVVNFPSGPRGSTANWRALCRRSVCGFRSVTRVLVVHVLLLLLGFGSDQSSLFGDAYQWLNHGGDLANRRNNWEEIKISTISAKSLELKWKFNLSLDVTANPAISNGVLYFSSWDGNIYAVDEITGKLIWKQNVGNLTGITQTYLLETQGYKVFSRATPTVTDFLVIFNVYNPAVVIAVKILTGTLVWKTTLDDHYLGVVLMSGTAFEGSYYVGTSSREESLNETECCTFIGAMLRLDIATGAICWRTAMLPDNHGNRSLYSGVAVWGNSPPIDPVRRLVYIATGNTYTAPPNILACLANRTNLTSPIDKDDCIEAGNYQESVIALEIGSGKISWHQHLGELDVYINLCKPHPELCTGQPPGPDYDFGEMPMLLSIPGQRPGTKRDIAVTGQKSGYIYAHDRQSGELLWFKAAGPGASIWGLSTDGERVFTNVQNPRNKTFTLAPGTQNVTWGGWMALNASTGDYLWSTADPFKSLATAPIAHANGVLFAASAIAIGQAVILDAKTGDILQTYKMDSSVFGGFSISDGCAFVGLGVGYGHSAMTHGNGIRALCVPQSVN